MCSVLSIDTVLGNQKNNARPVASSAVNGNVWRLSQDPKGSRAVQQAIKDAASNQQRESLARELKGHICIAIQCPHANHVLQKCAATLEPASLQFIIDEIAEEGPQMICKLAQHRYACRVLEGLLARCAANQLFKIVGSLLADVVDMSMHRYANFVVQRLLEHEMWCPVVVRALEGKASELARSFFGSLVLTHILREAPKEDKVNLSKIIASDSSLVSEVKRFRHGSTLIELVMTNAGEP